MQQTIESLTQSVSRSAVRWILCGILVYRNHISARTLATVGAFFSSWHSKSKFGKHIHDDKKIFKSSTILLKNTKINRLLKPHMGLKQCHDWPLIFVCGGFTSHYTCYNL